MQKWATTAGPIQTKRVNSALGELRMEAQARVEVSGVHDGRTAEQVLADHRASGGRKPDGSYDFSVTSYINMFGPTQNVSAVEEYAAVGERFGWTVTSENHKTIIVAVEEALVRAKAKRPIDDKRRTPEQDSESDARIAKQNTEQGIRTGQANAATAAALAKAPAWAGALIVAEYREDTSDIQTDYFANATIATYAIGFRSGKREDFTQLRAAAERFFASPRTDAVGTCGGGSEQHPCRHRGGMYGDHAPAYEGEGPHTLVVTVNGDEYAKITEHRDNYSMGQGNYLSTFGWGNAGTGWLVRSHTIDRANGAAKMHSVYTEAYIDALPDPEQAQSAAYFATEQPGDVRVRPSQMRDGYVEVAFAAKPAQDVIDELKGAGFRWALRSRVWYGPGHRLPERHKAVVA